MERQRPALFLTSPPILNSDPHLSQPFWILVLQTTLVGVFFPLCGKRHKTRRLSFGWFAFKTLPSFDATIKRHDPYPGGVSEAQRACMSLLGHQQHQQCSVSVPHTVMTLHTFTPAP